MNDCLLKVEGSGNDFLLGVGEWADRLVRDSELVVGLCRRRRGVGADGVLAVFAENRSAIRLVHRNADGSPSDFCANGTRCAARAAVERLGCSTELTIHTGWAAIGAAVEDEAVTLDLPASTAPREITLATTDRRVTGWYLEIGVPHLVIAVPGLDEVDMRHDAAPLRRHPSLPPEGANIHLIEADREGVLAIRSFERGVEDEVLCCGSGVVAAGLVAMAEAGVTTITVIPRSGDHLRVEAAGAPPACASRLTGPARIVAEINPL